MIFIIRENKSSNGDSKGGDKIGKPQTCLFAMRKNIKNFLVSLFPFYFVDNDVIGGSVTKEWGSKSD